MRKKKKGKERMQEFGLPSESSSQVVSIEETKSRASFLIFFLEESKLKI